MSVIGMVHMVSERPASCIYARGEHTVAEDIDEDDTGYFADSYAGLVVVGCHTRWHGEWRCDIADEWRHYYALSGYARSVEPSAQAAGAKMPIIGDGHMYALIDVICCHCRIDGCLFTSSRYIKIHYINGYYQH